MRRVRETTENFYVQWLRQTVVELCSACQLTFVETVGKQSTRHRGKMLSNFQPPPTNAATPNAFSVFAKHKVDYYDILLFMASRKLHSKH